MPATTPRQPRLRRPEGPLARFLAAALAALLLAALVITQQATQRGAHSSGVTLVRDAVGNPPTPGNFTGYGFDQCQAPSQAAMDTWLATSPYLAVGIYISGDSRACRNQTYLNATWVSTQLANGWRLLPITLGPQAHCNPRFPRYGTDPVISIATTNGAYTAAAAQGTAEADKALSAAAALGIVPGSTMYYDLEAFDATNTSCRDSALTFLSAWTTEIKAHGYLSGVYSSASSGLKVLDQIRQSNPGAYTLPDQVWIADWNQQANTSSSYVSPTGWNPHARVKQYQGGHNETHGGVTINIDRDFLDVGQGSVAPTESHCGGIPVDFPAYRSLKQPGHGTTVNAALKPYVKALKCLLSERAGYTGKVNATFGRPLVAAIKAWRGAHGFSAGSSTWNRRLWISLFAADQRPILKQGSASSAVRDVQRAMVAAEPALQLAVTGVYDGPTKAAVAAYQKAHGIKHRGIVGPSTWAALGAGVV